MAKVLFVGDPNNRGDGPEQITINGYTIGREEPTDVDDEAALKKFRANSHFTVDGEAARRGPAEFTRAKRPEPAPASPRRGKPAAAAQPAPEAEDDDTDEQPIDGDEVKGAEDGAEVEADNADNVNAVFEGSKQRATARSLAAANKTGPRSTAKKRKK